MKVDLTVIHEAGSTDVNIDTENVSPSDVAKKFAKKLGKQDWENFVLASPMNDSIIEDWDSFHPFASFLTRCTRRQV